jgi:hypothetical protein
MTRWKKGAATPQLPLLSHSLKELARQAQDCKNCDLWRNATQTVFGDGSPRAPIMLVGEQPGDQEDLQGNLLSARLENYCKLHCEKQALIPSRCT